MSRGAARGNLFHGTMPEDAAALLKDLIEWGLDENHNGLRPPKSIPLGNRLSNFQRNAKKRGKKCHFGRRCREKLRCQFRHTDSEIQYFKSLERNSSGGGLFRPQKPWPSRPGRSGAGSVCGARG